MYTYMYMCIYILYIYIHLPILLESYWPRFRMASVKSSQAQSIASSLK